MKALVHNITAGPVATLIGVVTLVCQTAEIQLLHPLIAPACALIAGISLLFAKFK